MLGVLMTTSASAVIALLLAAEPSTPPPGPTSAEVRRLVHLGQLWSTVKTFHPALFTTDLDWDGALIEAEPRVRSARTKEEFAAAVEAMLEKLGAPLGTHLLREPVKRETAACSPSEQKLGPPAAWTYGRPVVTLIDERAMSLSEATALFIEAAHGTTFVGSPTAGANGDITLASLPGGGWLQFSGHDVRHADGRQLQQVGIVPDVEVRPTVAGVRAGRDEVLEVALKWIDAHVK
jgi:hypothetical protein